VGRTGLNPCTVAACLIPKMVKNGNNSLIVVQQFRLVYLALSILRLHYFFLLFGLTHRLF
jgi:hypothetical protein